MKRFFLAGLLGFGSVAASNAVWPDLPHSGFIAGRLATKDDFKRGNAVFWIEGAGNKVLHLQIPQYVLWRDEKGKERPMILVQAERVGNGTEVVGLRDFNGNETVATLAEVKLLGTKKPN